jgi:molybdenum cofactor cytidylyltransferase
LDLNNLVLAIVLAAGESRRMGVPKLNLPWGKLTVIGQVVHVLHAGAIAEIIVVTGGAKREVETALDGEPVRLVENPDYAVGGMLSSVQTGIKAALDGVSEAGLIVLGDQPQIRIEVVQQLLHRRETAQAKIIVPSYKMRRGHPWIIERSMWQAVLELQPRDSLRTFLSQRRDMIDYLAVDTESILLDLDTPLDYQNQKPEKE